MKTIWAAGRLSREPLNPAAAYFIARIAGRLGGEVIRFCVKDDGFAHNIGQSEPFIIKDAESIALVAKKRRHIPCMIGMRRI